MLKSTGQKTGLYALSQINAAKAQPAPQNKILKMTHNDRMAGSIPAWEKPVTAQDKVESTIAAAQNPPISHPETALGYNGQATQNPNTQSEEFTFGDLVDMVNPLHHIPVVGYAYREITGDQIKPIGKIIGGGIFGGPLGAAGGLVDTIVTYETGKDIAGNAVDLAFHRNKSSHTAPEIKIEQALNTIEPSSGDISSALLSFADLGEQDAISIKRIDAANGRTAGSFTTRARPDLETAILPPREPITQISFLE